MWWREVELEMLQQQQVWERSHGRQRSNVLLSELGPPTTERLGPLKGHLTLWKKPCRLVLLVDLQAWPVAWNCSC